MIKQTIPLLFSLFIHTIVLFILFYTWNNKQVFEKKTPQTSCEQRCNVKLCCVAEKKIVPIEQKKIEIPKTLEMIKPIKEEKIVEKIVPLKNIPLQKKIIPVIKDIPKLKQEPVKEKIIQANIVKNTQTIEQKTIKNTTIQAIKSQEVPTKEIESSNKKSIQQEYLDTNLQQITQLLKENLYYPHSARKRGIMGEVIVKFKLSTEAKVYSIEIIKSNKEILSRAAIQTIENLSHKFPKPHEEMILEVPILYRLQ